jgi:hypothetical protein
MEVRREKAYERMRMEDGADEERQCREYEGLIFLSWCCYNIFLAFLVCYTAFGGLYTPGA